MKNTVWSIFLMLFIRVFQNYKFSLFVNGVENVAVYGTYKDNIEIIGILELEDAFSNSAPGK